MTYTGAMTKTRAIAVGIVPFLCLAIGLATVAAADPPDPLIIDINPTECPTLIRVQDATSVTDYVYPCP